MEKETTTEPKPKKKKNKKIVIIIVLVIVILLSAIGLFVYSRVADKPISEIFSQFAPEETEHVVPLEEFLVNLNSEYGDSKQYLRINMSLMYTDSKQTEKIQANISLIRDLVISSLREITIENVLLEETMTSFKQTTMESINDSLGQGLIKEVYITDVIVK
jgi:flagellar basal body-associated protein FliL